LVLALVFAIFYGFSKHLVSLTGHNGYNVVVIMADDQDMLLDSMSYMPKTNKLIAEQGVTYMNHYCTVAWCCPSRVNFFTGKAAHNTNVTSTRPPHGGWPKFASQGHNENYLATWIHEAGVRTYYLGKFMNWYGEENMATPAYPRGWMNSSMILRQGWLNYYGTRWTNGYTKVVTRYNGIHQTDVIHHKSMEYIEDAAKRGSPFFMMIAPVAPHQTKTSGPPPIQKKWRGKFDGHKAPRKENWNPDEPSGASVCIMIGKTGTSNHVAAM
jgi:arylsulfatase A-like enzyme